MASMKGTAVISNPEPTIVASVYKCSRESLCLLGEIGRKLHPEDLKWTERQVPSLREICVLSLACSLKSFSRPRSAYASMLSTLRPEDVTRFLQVAPTDTPLAIAAALLPDGIYWQRKASATWSTRNWPRLHGGSWRRLVSERLVQDCLESLTPKTFKAALETVRPLGSFVVALRLLKLMESCEDGENALDLVQLELDLRGLFEHFINLEELHLMFDHTDFLKPLNLEPNPVKVSCCRAIGLVLSNMKRFRVLNVRRSQLQKPKLVALLNGLTSCAKLKQMDLTSCSLRNDGGQLLAEALPSLVSLQELHLADNAIGSAGGIVIGDALRTIFSKGVSRLSVLDFSLNWLADVGAYAILSSLCQTKYPPIENEDDLERALISAPSANPIPEIQKSKTTEKLRVCKGLTYYGFPKARRQPGGKGSVTQLFMAAVEMTHALSGLIQDVIVSTDSLIILDIRNNHLGADICAALSKYDQLIRLDARMSGGTPYTEAALWSTTLQKTNEIRPHFNLRAIRDAFEKKLRDKHLARKPCVQPPQTRISIGGALAVSVAVPHWRKHSLRGYVPDTNPLGPGVTKVPFVNKPVF